MCLTEPDRWVSLKGLSGMTGPRSRLSIHSEPEHQMLWGMRHGLVDRFEVAPFPREPGIQATDHVTLSEYIDGQRREMGKERYNLV